MEERGDGSGTEKDHGDGVDALRLNLHEESEEGFV
jgi:hypothetical protein